AEKYLEECIDSVLMQDFTDYELILINDGSKDKSGFICDAYAKKDNRIKVFHQENKGVSAARNLGIKNVRGEWITFIDSDDWIEQGYLSGFFNLNKNPRLALTMTGYAKQKKDKSYSYEKLPKGTYSSLEFSSLFKKINLIKKWPFTIGKLYDNEIIQKE